MSLFRTLQHSPATVTLFHNGKIPASKSLYELLDKAYYKLNDKDQKFQVDLMADKMPTYDQFSLINSSCLKDNDSIEVFKLCFPFMSDKKHRNDERSVTVKSPVGLDSIARSSHGILMFSQGEYDLIYEAFNLLVEAAEPEFDTSVLFRAPLVVDWDQSLIASDKEGLDRLLKKYTE